MAEVKRNEDEQQYEISLGGGQMAILAYDERNERMVLTHTEVPASHEGKGLGSQLVKAAANDARERGLKIVPQCSYARTWFERHREQGDVLAEAREE